MANCSGVLNMIMLAPFLCMQASGHGFRLLLEMDRSLICALTNQP